MGPFWNLMKAMCHHNSQLLQQNLFNSYYTVSVPDLGSRVINSAQKHWNKTKQHALKELLI